MQDDNIYLTERMLEREGGEQELAIVNARTGQELGNVRRIEVIKDVNEPTIARIEVYLSDEKGTIKVG